MQLYVLGFMFSENSGWVSLIRKSKPAWQDGRLNGIGGKVEFGETTSAAMAREFQEEAGVTTELSDWEYFCTMRGGDWEVTCFKCFSDRVFEVKTQEDETVELFTVKEALEHREVLSNLKWLIPLALDKNIEYGFYY